MNFDPGNFIAAFNRLGPLPTSIVAIINILVFSLGRRPKWKIFTGTLLITLLGILFFSALSPPSPESELMLKVNDPAPYCDTSNSDNANLDLAKWAVPNGLVRLTDIECPNKSQQGLLMTPSATSTPAEVDLDQVNGQTYSQTKLDAQVRVTFQNKQDDPNTMAGLLVQTPQHGKGGYELWIDNIGDWQLEDNSGKITASQKVTPSSTDFTTLEMKVYKNNLYLWINGNQVFTCSDTLNPAVGGIGLVANGNNTPSSSVLFSNFTLSL